MKYGRFRTLQSAKYLKKKRRKSAVIVLLSIISVFSVLIALTLFLRLSFLQISSVEVTGVSNPDVMKEMENKTLAGMEGYYLRFIPRSSFFFFPRNEIRAELIDSYKKINTIKINRRNLSSIRISINERLPEAIVCEDFKEDENNDRCFFADMDGYVFEKTLPETQEKYFKYYMNSASSTLPIGSNFIDSDEFKQLQEFTLSVNSAGIPTSGILLGENNVYELYIKNKDQSLAIVYFDNRTPFDKTSSNLIAFWQNAMDRKIGTSTIPIFDYINLRFGNNIFYVTR